ncbi:MAG: GrpB family protein [Steroidobacteraceae bacterium]
MSSTVRFSNAPEIFATAERLFLDVKARLQRMLPDAEIMHVGSTAIPGALTKGDLDIVVRVAPAYFKEADRQLANLFDRNAGSLRNEEFSAFQDVASNPELGIQLVVKGASDDHFLLWRQLLEQSLELRQAYDELKMRFEGAEMEAYRAAKAIFIETHLGLRR